MTAPTLYPWRLARVLRQLSQVEVSRRAAVNQSYYSQIERHQVKASLSISARLWAVLAPSGDYETTPVLHAVRDPATGPIAPAVCEDLAAMFTATRSDWADTLARLWFTPPLPFFVLPRDLDATWIWWLGVWAWARRGTAPALPHTWPAFAVWAEAVLAEVRSSAVSAVSTAVDWPMMAWQRLDPETQASVRWLIERLASS